MATESVIDVLVVGAGPTGLALAAQLERCGAGLRIVDRAEVGVGESRALAVLPRTLEVLSTIGVADAMVERGNPTVWLEMHAGARTTRLPLFDIGLADTRFPFLLFLSQAETEAILDGHLADHGVMVERGVELVDLQQGPDRVVCTMRGGEEIAARYVVGCDGANSTVRALAGVDFVGSPYPQTFVLADLAATGLGPDAAHVYLSRAGMLFFFPLGRPAPWRLLGIAPAAVGQPELADLQALADAYTQGVGLGEPVWASVFGLQQRRADRYRAERVLLAGDAAHVHSPAGAQGMNTGIQDAWNLGWKLALVTNGTARPELLDTYQHEREPVGRDVVRFTDRAFRIATSRSRLVGGLRTHVAPRLLQAVSRSRRARSAGFRALSQLAVTYKGTPGVHDDRPRPRRPRAGDRLPDAAVVLDGDSLNLHQVFAAARFHLLITGDELALLPNELVDVHQLTRQPQAGALVDIDGQAHQRLGIDPTAGGLILVRPDGHIAYRCNGTDPTGLNRYLSRWLTSTN